jgi:hypothetical protein
MHRALTLAFAILTALAMRGDGITVSEILAKNAAAKGGIERLRAIQSLKMTGKVVFGSTEAPFVMTKMRPDRMRIELSMQGITSVQSFDGSTAWSINPFIGQKDPGHMPADDAKAFRDQSDFDGPLIDSETKGAAFTILGKDTIEGAPVYRIRMTARDGAESTISIDATTFLEIRIEGRRKIQGLEMETETTLKKYTPVEGVLFPFSIESRTKGLQGGQSVVIETIEINPEIEEASFRMPEKKAASTPKP